MIVNDSSWKDHILMIVAKANRLLGFIRKELRRNCQTGQIRQTGQAC